MPELPANLPARFAAGVEFAPLNTMPSRIGFGPQDPVAGAGLMLPLESFALQIDYAFYRDELVQSPVHQVSVAIAFFRNSSSGKTSRPQIETGPPVTRSSPSRRGLVQSALTQRRCRLGAYFVHHGIDPRPITWIGYMICSTNLPIA